MTSPGDPLPVGHPSRGSTIAHATLTILGPSTAQELDRLIDVLAPDPGTRALDIGCGKGDLLVRLARRGVVGLGIDRNPAFLADASRLAAAAGVDDRVRFELGDAAEVEAVTADGDGFDIVICIGATGALGGPVEAPARLAALAAPGGCVLIGEGFWRLEPEPAWLQEFGVEPGELVDRAATLARMTAAGLELLAAEDATLGGWDAYEDAYAGALEAWLAAHPDDPERDELADTATLFRDTWARWRRETMGFLVAVLRVSPGRRDS